MYRNVVRKFTFWYLDNGYHVKKNPWWVAILRNIIGLSPSIYMVYITTGSGVNN